MVDSQHFPSGVSVRQLTVALFHNAKDNEPQTRNVSWPELREVLTQHRPRKLKDGPAWSPVEYRHKAQRSKANVENVQLLVFDFDNLDEVRRNEVFDKLDGYEYAAHTTWRGPRGWRVVLPLEQAVRGDTWKNYYEGAARELGVWDFIDQSCRDPSRLFYLPSAPEGTEALVVLGEGRWFSRSATPAPSPAPIADKPPLALPQPGTPLAEPGSRDNTLLSVASRLVWTDPSLSDEAVLAKLLPNIVAMETKPEGLEHWVERAKTHIANARGRRNDTDAHEAALGQVLLGNREELDGLNLIDSNMLRDKNQQPKPLEYNILLYLRLHPEWAGKLRWDELHKTVRFHDTPVARASTATLPSAVAEWMQRQRLFAKPHQCGAAVLQVARENSYDPVKEHILSLPAWDGRPRISRFFGQEVLTEVHDLEYTEKVSRKFFLSMVARGLNPGCQMDNLLILEGAYGIRKSQLVRLLGAEFTCTTKFNFRDKDSRMVASRYWLIEVPELVGLQNSEREALKAYLSMQVDSIRLPYAPAIEDFPRHCVFVGTTNSDKYLTEPNRREWPLKLASEKIDLDRVAKIRDQLLAEALVAFRAGEPWWMTREEEQMTLERAKERAVPDLMGETLLDWAASLKQEERIEYATPYKLMQLAFRRARGDFGNLQLQTLRDALMQLGCKPVALKSVETPGRRGERFDIRRLYAICEGREDSKALGEPGGELRQFERVGVPEKVVVSAGEGSGGAAEHEPGSWDEDSPGD